MLNDEIKKQAREIAKDGEMSEANENIITIGVSQSSLDAMPEDARAWQESAWESEEQRRDGTLEENERKYDAAMSTISIDEDGNIEETMVVAYARYIDGEQYLEFTAYGYDILPPDIQDKLGQKEDVVENLIPRTNEMDNLVYAYLNYTHLSSEGHDSWEEYRDAKGLGPKEEVTISKAQDVDSNDKPKGTPAVEQDESPARNNQTNALS